MERLTIRYNGEKVPFCPPCVKCATRCDECEHLDRMMQKLADYEDAEEQGLLLRLPVAIGKTVYSFDRQIWIDEKGCRDCVYYAIDGFCDYEEEYPACTKVFETKFEFNMRDDFGKTVFLTKEEAEQALKQIGE